MRREESITRAGSGRGKEKVCALRLRMETSTARTNGTTPVPLIPAQAGTQPIKV